MADETIFKRDLMLPRLPKGPPPHSGRTIRAMRYNYLPQIGVASLDSFSTNITCRSDFAPPATAVLATGRYRR